MKDKKFLEEYGGQSIDELIELEATHRADSIILAFEEALDRKREQQGERSVSDVERVILAIEALEREVNNGGFNQFFTNPSYVFVPGIVACLNKISCLKTAAITQKAIDALCLDKLDFDSIVDRVNEDDETLNSILKACDHEFYGYPDDIETRLFEYIKTNRENIKFV